VYGSPLALTVLVMAVPDRSRSIHLARSTIRRTAARHSRGSSRSRRSLAGVGHCSRAAPSKEILAGLVGWRSLGDVSGRNLNAKSPVMAARQLVLERYVGRAELAAIMAVSLATIDRMVAEGMPSVTWGRRTRRFRPSAAISWASERERAA
jgi:hypothetical protein